MRIGLAGGGTDVSPYSDEFGGAILNATISHYAHAVIEPLDKGGIVLNAMDRKESERFEKQDGLPINGTLDLHKGVSTAFRKIMA